MLKKNTGKLLPLVALVASTAGAFAQGAPIDLSDAVPVSYVALGAGAALGLFGAIQGVKIIIKAWKAAKS